MYCKTALNAPSLVDSPVGGGIGGGVSSAPHMADLHAPDSACALFRLIEQGLEHLVFHPVLPAPLFGQKLRIGDDLDAPGSEFPGPSETEKEGAILGDVVRRLAEEFGDF